MIIMIIIVITIMTHNNRRRLRRRQTSQGGARFGRASETSGNTSVFDAGRDPALCFPCSEVDGLSVGMMLVGRQHEEALLYRLYHACERARD